MIGLSFQNSTAYIDETLSYYYDDYYPSRILEETQFETQQNALFEKYATMSYLSLLNITS